MMGRFAVMWAAIAALTQSLPTTVGAVSRPDAELLEPVAEPAPIEMRPSYAPPPALAAPRGGEPGGNPLWAIPLSALSATRERPLFAPSRRPPPPVMPNAPVAVVPVIEQAPPPAPETRVALTLIGTIANDTDGMAIFSDPNTREVVRLRVGDVVAGWTLDAVRNREVTFRKADREDTLAIPAQNSATAAGMPTPEFIPNKPNGESE